METFLLNIAAAVHFLLFFYFILINYRFGALQKYVLRWRMADSTDSDQAERQPGRQTEQGVVSHTWERNRIRVEALNDVTVSNVFIAHIKSFHLIIVQVALAFLLIETNLGHDILDSFTQLFYLKQPRHDLTNLFLLLFSMLLFATAIWLIPWHLLPPNTRVRLFHNKTLLKKLRFLAMFTFVILLAGLIASIHGKNGQAEWVREHLMLGISLIYVLYWSLACRDEGKDEDGKMDDSRDTYWHSLFFWVCFCLLLFLGGLLAYQNDEPSKILAMSFVWGTGIIFWFMTERESKPGEPYRFLNIKEMPLLLMRRWPLTVFAWLKSALVHLDDLSNGFLLRYLRPMKEEYEPHTYRVAPNSELELNWLKHNRFAYRILMGSAVLFAGFISFVPNVMVISPLVLVFSGIAFLFLIADYLYYSGNRIFNSDQKEEAPTVGPKWYSPATVIHKVFKYRRMMFILLVSLFFFLGTNSHAGLLHIHPKELEQNRISRVDFHEYMHRFVEARKSAIDSVENYPVFIIAGQGGGSRAGYWMASGLLNFDKRFKSRLREHTLAISTVSGSSPGTVAAFQYWNKPKQFDSIDIQKYVQNVYSRNFISSGLAGNFYGDMIKKFWFWPINEMILHRNERLAREESWAMENGHNRSLGELTTRLNNDTFFANQPFTSLYFDSLDEGGFQARWPLFFPNITHIQTGRRALLNPILQDDIFINFKDIYADNYFNVNPNKDFSLVQAAGMSEYFPYVSGAGNIHGDNDMYGDGGYYENYGLTTALELFYAAMKWREEHNTGDSLDRMISKLDFYVLAFTNSKSLVLDDYGCTGQFTAPILTAINTRFLGHSEYKLEQARRDVGDCFVEFALGNQDVPLTRVLTQNNMLVMDSIMALELKKNKFLFENNLFNIKRAQ